MQNFHVLPSPLPPYFINDVTTFSISCKSVYRFWQRFQHFCGASGWSRINILSICKSGFILWLKNRAKWTRQLSRLYPDCTWKKNKKKKKTAKTKDCVIDKALVFKRDSVDSAHILKCIKTIKLKACLRRICPPIKFCKSVISLYFHRS